MAIFVIAFSIYCLFIEVYIFFALTESPSPGGIQSSTSQRSLTSNPPDVPPRSSPRLLQFWHLWASYYETEMAKHSTDGQ
jgi:hypothetical protein